MAIAGMTIDERELRDIQQALKLLPEKFRRRVVRPSINVALTPVLKSIKKLVPVGRGQRPDGRPRRHLRDALAKKVRTYSGSGNIVGLVGHTHSKADRSAAHAHLVEFGRTATRSFPKAKQVLTNQRTHDENPTFFGKLVNIPATKGSHHVERGANRALPQFESKLFERTKLNLNKILTK